ncbi:MAG: substrate-binding domain-containing protein [Pirellulales bacterium]
MLRYVSILILTVVAAGCTPAKQPPAGGSGSAGSSATVAAPQTIVLQTTTSPRDTGLLDMLLPLFKQQTGIDVKVVAVGSGQALENARRGDGDVIVAHSPEAEEKFMADGFGTVRKPLMENDFLIVGPAGDPAGVKQAKSAAEAFKLIADKKAPFISRNDESGTHVKEKAVWKAAGLDPVALDAAAAWYVRAGLGMAAALRMTDEKQAYTLCDRGTYLSQKAKVKLDELFAGDPVLVNKYSVIAVSGAKHPGLNEAAARKFADFLTTPETKRLIGEFGRKEYGQSLFKPRDE